MPHIKISGLAEPTVKALSAELTKSLSSAIDCPTDWLTFSADATNIYCNGNNVTDTVFVHVEWFDRGDNVKSTVAKIITGEILSPNKLNIANVETVDVIFINHEKTSYYENGEHF